MNAWLLTWEWSSAKPPEKIVAILSSRRSETVIADLMELLVLRATFPAKAVAYYANRTKKMLDKAERSICINGVPHGDRIFCGHDPRLYGRKVRDLKVTIDEESDQEMITWREPSILKWADESKASVVVASAGVIKHWCRPNRPLSKDIWAWEL